MNVPWKKLSRKAWDVLVQVVRATAPDKGQADPPPEPTATEAFDKWRGGGTTLLLALALTAPLSAQVPDAACLRVGRVAVDSLAKRHLTKPALTQYQLRAIRTLDSLHAARCVTTPVPPPPDTTTPPDTTPPSPPARTLTLTTTDTLVRLYPATPSNAFVSVRYDSSGTVSDTATLVIRPALARLGFEKSRRAWTVYSPTANGVLYAVASRGGITDSVRIRVVVDTTGAPPPPPPPPPPVIPAPVGWVAIIDSLLGPIPDCGAVKASTNPTVRLWLTNWEKWEAAHWLSDSTSWSAANYYDRASAEYAMAACYAKSDSARAATHLARGHAIAVAYRDDYLALNDGGVPNHQMQLEGVALHALLTGDAASRRIIGRTADVALGGYYKNRTYGVIAHRDMENRITQRAVLSVLLSMRLQSPGKSVAVAEWPRKLDSLLVMSYRAQKPNGKWCYRCTPAFDSMTATLPYMDGLLVDAAQKYATWYSNGPQVSRLATLRRTTYDFLLDSAMRADSSFNYNLTPSPVVGGKGPTPDLNGFHPHNLFVLWLETGNVRYRDAAAVLFDKGVRAGFYSGTKQFNQLYYSSYRYVARLLAPTP